jgi:energy-coupling factor transporter transmembrane protein EcfT
MAELTSFGFRPGATVIHRLDGRFKFVFLIMISLAILHANIPGLGLLMIFLIFLFSLCALSLITGLRELRYFYVLLLFVFIARVLSSQGPQDFYLLGIMISQSGIIDGAIVCWRLILIVLLGLLFMSTTRSAEIKSAVQWFLQPVPWVSETKVATMMSLVLRFMPVIFEQARQTADAQRARGVENRKNPVYRLVKLGGPLVRRTFEKADNLVVAMEARCFNDQRTDPDLSSHKRDWMALLVVLSLCIIMVYLRII